MPAKTRTVTEKRWGFVDMFGVLFILGKRGQSQQDFQDAWSLFYQNERPVRVTLTYEVPT